MKRIILTAMACLVTGVALATPGPEPISNETAVADDTKANADTPVSTEGAEPEDKFVVPPGYRTKKMGDKTMYCREEKVTGSRFRSEKCYTEAKLKALELAREQASRDLDQKRIVCSNPATCASQ